jgi:hypothetical protein
LAGISAHVEAGGHPKKSNLSKNLAIDNIRLSVGKNRAKTVILITSPTTGIDSSFDFHDGWQTNVRHGYKCPNVRPEFRPLSAGGRAR